MYNHSKLQKMTRLIHILPLLLLIFFSGCKPKTSGEQEVNKLLERQVQLLESGDESLDELQQLTDSLEHERMLLIDQRDRKDQQVKRLEQNQQKLADRLKQEEQSAVSAEKEKLQKSISEYEDSIEQLKNELARLDVHLDSIDRNMELYQLQERQAEKILASGISEVDQRMNKLERQKRQEIKKLDLLKKRIRIPEKKIEAYNLERKMYQDDMNELLRIKATEDQLSPYREKIAELDSIISTQEALKSSINEEIRESEQWIAGVDSMVNDLQQKIKQEYDKNQIIEGFITSEKKRLSQELERMNKTREKLIAEQEMILNDLASIEKKIASLNKRMELIRNRDMSQILEQQAAIEKSDAALAEVEIRLLAESAEIDKQMTESTKSDSISEELQSLQLLSNRLDSLKAAIQEEKTELVKARLKLSEKKAEAADKRARFSRTMGLLITIMLIAGLGLLTLFYYLGRRARKSS